MEEFIGEGFRAVVVCVNGSLLDPSFVGGRWTGSSSGTSPPRWIRRGKEGSTTASGTVPFRRPPEGEEGREGKEEGSSTTWIC